MKYTFTAGQRLQIAGAGDFFRLLSTTSPVTVEFYFQGREIAERVDVEAGFAEQFRVVDFDRVDITSPLAQTVQFETAKGSEIRYDRGSATISGTVEIGSASLAALETVNTIYKPEDRTGTYNSSAASAAGTPITIFTPASNTNGVILLDAHIAILESNAGLMAFLTKSSAPSNINDGDVVLASTMDIYGSTCVYSGRLPKERFIKAGEGLYFITTMIANGSANLKAASWKTL